MTVTDSGDSPQRGMQRSFNELEERYRSLMMATSQIVGTTDAAGRFDAEVPAWGEFTGQSFEAMRGFGWLDAIHPEDRAGVEAGLQEAARQPGLRDTEFRLRRFDGVYRYFAARSVPILDENGRARGWIGSLRDIDEHKRIEESLRANLHRIESLNAISVAIEQSVELDEMVAEVIRRLRTIFDSDRAWILFPADPEATTMRVPFECATPEWPGALAQDVEVPMDPNSRDLIIAALATGEAVTQDFTPPDWEVGDHFTIRSLMAIAIRPRLGKPWMLGLHQCSHARAWSEAERRLFRDIAQRMGDAFSSYLYHEERARLMAEEQIIRAEAEAMRTLDRLKSTFVNSVSHELRTPLTTIRGYAEFLEDGIGGAIPPEALGFVSQIERAARRLEYLVNDLLDHARMEAGTFGLKVVEADLVAKVSEVVASLRPQIGESRLELVVSLPPGELIVPMDPERIGQVLTNLLTNAMKFTAPGGRIEILTTHAADYLEVQVVDTGLGIAPADMPRLFKQFGQLEDGVRTGKGTGLGLSISKALIEAHGGEIGVDSEPAVGSTFWFRLPLNAPPD